jgi:anti-sigma regulatory factor (Ser/Thr protein kinase)
MNTGMRNWPASEGREGQQPPGVPPWPAQRTFRQGDVPAVRRFTRAFGARAGIASARLGDLVLAASEAAACATAGGPCTARIRLWMSGNRAFCEVRGDGLLLRRAAHRARTCGRPDEEEALRRFVLRRLADYVSVATSPDDGICVLLSMSVA